MAAEHRSTARLDMSDDINKMDANAWASHLAPDVVMRFGNADPVYGRDACRDALAAFYARIGGLRRDVIELWEHGAATIVEANLTYTRKDGTDVAVPAVTIYRTDDQGLVSDYRIYIDLAPVFAEA
jgi:ketosteroid isomerase-like protein